MTPWEADRIQAIVDGVDYVARQYEIKWGVGRLRLLVDNDLRQRFDTQARLFNESVWAFEPTEAEGQGNALIRGWHALDQAATAAGQNRLNPEVWEIRHDDGSVVAVVRTNAEAGQVVAEGRHVQVWTMQEVANVMAANSLVGKAKQIFPGLKVEKTKVITREQLNDDIPF